MWYLYCLIGLYLLLPFYKKIVNGSSKKEIMYLMVLYVIFLSVIPLIWGWDIHTGFYIHVSTVYPLYFFAGFYLNEYRDYSQKLSVIILILTIILATLSCISWYGIRDILGGFFEYNLLIVIIVKKFKRKRKYTYELQKNVTYNCSNCLLYASFWR